MDTELGDCGIGDRTMPRRMSVGETRKDLRNGIDIRVLTLRGLEAVSLIDRGRPDCDRLAYAQRSLPPIRRCWNVVYVRD